ncbi:MAG: hypothetical protein CVU56_06075 [Deltaproteobacteria bacterium HGW-Deltaproteobacteria-14]|jgi:hypothetical protein|nr:MAG: hypothetical protein CVU56_06075 [Deltaproteobacteria bacterium HGW-Deltaproteobacteria-14]
MGFLLTSLLALLLGPVLATAFRRSDRVLAGLDGFVIAAIVGLVVLHILPHAVGAGGLWVMAAAVVGLLLPSVVERRLHGRGARSAGRGVIALIAIGLAIHAGLDGAALALPDDHHDDSGVLLAAGVILHRIPVGIAIWGAARPLWGSLGAGLFVAFVAAATAVGFGVGEEVLGALSGPFLGAFEALVAGTLLHVVAGHRLPALASATPHRFVAGVGALLGVAVHVAILDTHFIPDADAGLPASVTFTTLALAAAPALLIGFAAVAGAAWVASRGFWPRAAGRLARAARGVLSDVLGVIEPGATPGGGAPRPLLGPLAILVSLPLLGSGATATRVAIGLIVLFTLALARRQVVAPTGVSEGWRAQVMATVDHEAPWFVAGVALAAMLEPVLPCSLFDTIAAPWQVVMAAAFAAPWYLSASGMTPLAAVMLHKGASPGAVIVFLIVGAGVALRVPTCHDPAHRRAIRRDGAITIAIVVVSAWIADAIFARGDGLALHHEASLAPSAVAVVGAVALGLLTVVALLRQGPRGFIAQITGHGDDAHDDHDHAHDHAHDHDHDHDHDAAPHDHDPHDHDPHDHDGEDRGGHRHG